MNNWQKLCEQVSPLIKDDVSEDLFHRLFESYLKTIFNWDSGIHHKMQVPMGSVPKQADIVLKGSDYGIVIEMKKPSAVLGDNGVEQLTSYMRILRYKFGFLIGNEFRVFYDDGTSSTPIQVASFGFDPTNSDGISLCEILDKNICSNEKLKEYAAMHINRIQTQQKKEQLKAELLKNNGEKIKEIIKNKLISDEHDENYINDIIENIIVNYKSTNNQQEITVEPLRNADDSDKHHPLDHTQYKFMDNVYAKNGLVLAIIKDYIQNNAGCTLEGLQKTFPKKLQGSHGVIDTFKNADGIYKKTGYKRHFLGDKIPLKDEQQIVVCNQWTKRNIDLFIDKARELGYNIEEAG
jgi:hypothetical protein